MVAVVVVAVVVVVVAVVAVVAVIAFVVAVAVVAIFVAVVAVVVAVIAVVVAVVVAAVAGVVAVVVAVIAVVVAAVDAAVVVLPEDLDPRAVFKLTYEVLYNTSQETPVTSSCGEFYAHRFLGNFVKAQDKLNEKCKDLHVKVEVDIKARVRLYGNKVGRARGVGVRWIRGYLRGTRKQG